ncbi:MAG: tRNA 2-selenouridine(34) synthase MnmH [Bacteroidales bacterium]|jgi:tRNA 2-selenouridine synthase|nr:tRNA 2-selenouridine(34) synthase MnmH [Bacteroidales bacterium]
MPEKLGVLDFYKFARHIPVIDVRSPGEYDTGHIPGAMNIPIFDNEERALVGTAYKQEGREPAVFKGLEIVGYKLRLFAEKARKIAHSNQLLVYCWRGGMRSASMAWLFETAGIKCYLLEGGYKAYRKFGKSQLSKGQKLIILGGYTGSGKTAILQELAIKGEQVLDLEHLANHKGSAFGALGEEKQPTNEQFENLLINEWLSFDLSRPIWIEDESHSIGSNWIPRELFDQMRKAPLIKFDLDKQSRVERLIKEYAGYNPKDLEHGILKISKRLGGQHTKEALEAIHAGNLKKAIEIVLLYYDKTYAFGMQKRTNQDFYTFPMPQYTLEKNAELLIQFAHKIYSPE